MKFAKLCNQCKGGDGRIRTKASKFGHHHTCTGCKAHICNIFAQGKFYANLFFRPVYSSYVLYAISEILVANTYAQ